MNPQMKRAKKGRQSKFGSNYPIRQKSNKEATLCYTILKL